MQRLLDAVSAAPMATLVCLALVGLGLYGLWKPAFRERMLLRPSLIGERGQFWAIFHSGFVHEDFRHLATNVVAFCFFGFPLERYMGYRQAMSLADGSSEGLQMLNRVWGHGKFLLLYVVCLILADLYTVRRHRKNPDFASLGASGAISGVLMACMVMAHSMREDIRLLGVLPGWVFVLGYLAYTLISAIRSYRHVDHYAHFFGALAGLVLVSLFFPYEAWLFVRQIWD